MLADRFDQANVALHSFTEKIDLSSATSRMFYNILGTFAEFYREQLAENVRVGMQQAVQSEHDLRFHRRQVLKGAEHSRISHLSISTRSR